MLNQVSIYLKYAGLQMAAEAIFPEGFVVGFIPLQTLKDGNTRSSKFPDALANQFINDWKVVAHKANTPTGFSGPLFECLVNAPSRGLVKGEFVLSFRSTEFTDDAVRDNQATNVMEISAHGWAFGQIADMEDWYRELKKSGDIPEGAKFSVTGYSLGGNLATAFNIMRQEQGESSRISGTYTFNGAGVGIIGDGSRDTTLQQLPLMISDFHQLRETAKTSQGLESLLRTALGKETYRALRTPWLAKLSRVRDESWISTLNDKLTSAPPANTSSWRQAA